MTEKNDLPAEQKRGWWARGVDKVDITPALIREEVLFTASRWRVGYVESEVDDFLDRTADKMEAIMRENTALRNGLYQMGLTKPQIEAMAEDRYVEIGFRREGS